MTIKRKLPGDRINITITGSAGDASSHYTETEFLALIARIIEDNSDLAELPTAFIEELLHSMAEADEGKVSEYLFDDEE